MKTLNQNVLGVVNAAVSSCSLIANSSLPDPIRSSASSLCSLLGGLTLNDLDQVQIELPDLPQIDSAN